jgi:hypothetical protein
VTAPTAPKPAEPAKLEARRTPTVQGDDIVVSFLLLGAAGAGKTHFSCGLPDPLFFAWDANLATMEKHPDIPYVVPSDFAPDGVCSTVAFSERVLPLLEARRAHEIAGKPVRSIVFDSGTEMLEDLSLHILGVNTATSTSLPKFGVFKTEGHKLLRRIAGLTRPKGDLPRYNVAMLFHLRETTNDAGALLKITPSIMGALKGEAPRHFDVVLLLRREVKNAVVTTGGAPGKLAQTIEHQAWTVAPDRYYEGIMDRLGGVGGTRWKQLPPCIIEPSYPRLIELWTKGE